MAEPKASYSPLIVALKIVLPLSALGLLATLFLISKPMPTQSQLPFSEAKRLDLISDQKITSPYYSGMTAGGDSVSLSARRILPDPAKEDTVLVEDIALLIKPRQAQQIRLTAGLGRYQVEKDELVVDQLVEVISDAGYRVSSPKVLVKLSKTWLRAEGPVEGRAPNGRLSAGEMEIFREEATQGLQIVFKGGIKLLYDPGK